MRAVLARLRVSALLLMALLCAGGSLAAGAGARPSTYIIGVENIDYYPHYAFSFRSSFAEELFAHFAETEQLHLEYSPLPVQRLYNELLHRRSVAFKFPDSPAWAPQRKQGYRIYYSDPVATVIDGIYVLPERQGLGIQAIRRLGIVQGFTPTALSETLAERRIELVTDGDLGVLLLMCLRGEIDGVYANLDLSHHWLTHTIQRPHGLVFDPKLPYIRSEYRLSTLQYPELIERFNRFMAGQPSLVARLRAAYGIEDRALPGGLP